jgi:hypothetical protein
MKYFTLASMMIFALTSRAQLVDPSFEGGTDASGWAQASTNFGTPLCTVDLCGDCGGGCSSYDGDWFVWFGGAQAGTEELGNVNQVLTIPDGNAASITFWCAIGNPGDSLSSEHAVVYIDDEVLWTLDASMTNYYTYTQKTIDLSAYADGQTHTFGVAGYSEEGASIIFDAFNLVVDGQNQVGINEFLNREQTISYYPNPANDKFNVRFNNGIIGSANVTITDITGKIVEAATLNNIYFTTYELNTARYENGIYMVTIENDGQVYTKRFAVSH